MTHPRFVRWAGWGMMAAGVCLLLTLLLPERSPAAVAILPFLFAIVLTTVGLLALYTRYAAQVGKAARVALLVGILGGAAATVACILWAAGFPEARTAMNLAMAVLFGGLCVYGLGALRTKPMARGNALPVLTGFWWPLIVVGSFTFQRVTGLWPQVSFWPSLALFLCLSLSLAALGYALQGDTPRERTAA